MSVSPRTTETTLITIFIGVILVIGVVAFCITAYTMASFFSPPRIHEATPPNASLPSLLTTGTNLTTPHLTSTEFPTPFPAIQPTHTFINEPAPTRAPSQGEPGALITNPRDGANVSLRVDVQGKIWNLGKRYRAFLCVRSKSFERLTWPMGEILPNNDGRWEVRSVYQSVGYPYETFVAVTGDPQAAAILADKDNRVWGIPQLPPNAWIISPVVVYTRR